MRALRVAMAVVARDLLLASRQRFAFVFAAMAFLGASFLPSIAAAEVGPLVASLPSDLFVYVTWTGAITAATWAQAIVLHRDSRDGGFEQLLLAAHSPLLILVAKAVSHWLLSGLLITAVAAMSAMQGAIPAQFSVFMLTSVVVGTITMSLIAVALAVLGVRQSSTWTATNLYAFPLQVLVAVVAVAISHGLRIGVPLPESILLLAGVPVFTWPLIHAAIAPPRGSLPVKRR